MYINVCLYIIYVCMNVCLSDTCECMNECILRINEGINNKYEIKHGRFWPSDLVYLKKDPVWSSTGIEHRVQCTHKFREKALWTPMPHSFLEKKELVEPECRPVIMATRKGGNSVHNLLLAR